jgi:hypothetical protein
VFQGVCEQDADVRVVFDQQDVDASEQARTVAHDRSGSSDADAMRRLHYNAGTAPTSAASLEGRLTGTGSPGGESPGRLLPRPPRSSLTLMRAADTREVASRCPCFPDPPSSLLADVRVLVVEDHEDTRCVTLSFARTGWSGGRICSRRSRGPRADHGERAKRAPQRPRDARGRRPPGSFARCAHSRSAVTYPLSP